MRKLLKARRFLSLVLAVAMVLSIASTLTVFAEENAAVEVGSLAAHADHPTQDAEYIWTSSTGAAVSETWKSYYAENADCVKLLKKGATEAIGIGVLDKSMTGDGILLNRGENVFCIRQSQWYLNCAGHSELTPMAAGDTLIVGGKFTGEEGTVVNITTTYITMNDDGTFTFGDKLPTTEPEAIEVGSLVAHADHPTQDAEYIWTSSTGAAVSETWKSYYAENADCVKLLKKGATEAIGIGVLDKSMTGDGILLNRGENVFCIRQSQWYLNCAGHSELTPMAAGDTLIVGGKFTGEGGTVVNITTTYITMNDDGTFTFGDKLPTTEPEAIEVGSLAAHADHPTQDAEFIWTTSTGAAVSETWKSYYAENADCVKLLKKGATEAVGIGALDMSMTTDGILLNRGENVFCIRQSQWLLNCAGHSELTPMAAGDTLIVGGKFTGEEGTVINITTTYITMNDNGTFTFGDKLPDPEPIDPPQPTVIEAGAMGNHPNGKADSGFYFTMPENDIPADETWATRYMPVTTDVIKLTRNGETRAVGNTAGGTILKYSATEYWLENWTIGGALIPGDVLTVEGKFTNSDNSITFNIIRSYVIIATDGSMNITTELPVEPKVIEAGYMLEDSRGRAESGIYFTMNVNEATYDAGWSVQYTPDSAACIQLIRGGETKEIANIGAEMIVKFSPTEYYLKLEQWMLGDVWPFADGDILVVDGSFTNASNNVTIKISKTYIQLKNGQAILSKEYPEDKPDEVIQAGSMLSDPRGKTATGIYFTMTANSAPYAEDWSKEYSAVSVDAIKLIRNGETMNVGIPNRGVIVKFSETEYYLKTEAWSMGEAMPLIDGDILVVEGRFANGKTVIEVSKSYILVDNGIAKISTEYPDGPDVEVIEAGAMHEDSEKKSLNVNTATGECGVYFTMTENAIAADSTWTNRFRSVTEESIKLIRDGKTISIGNTAAGEIVKYSATGYYLALDKWAHSAVYPITENDILLIEGNFTDGTTVFHISKSYISFSHGMAVFSEKYPDGGSEIPVINTSYMRGNERGRTDTGIYFELDKNAAPYETGWNISYCPASSACVKLIRNGQTTDVAISGRETIVKFSPTEYYLKTEPWTMGSYAPIVDGDILIVEGEFVNSASNTVISIPRTYIGIWYGMPFFSTTMPSGPSLAWINAGTMLKDERELQSTGVYFDMEKNGAPYRSDWSLEYSPVYASSIKLIRNGKTMSVGIPNRGTIVKFSDTEYYLKAEAWTMGGYAPLVDGDILVVDGQFINSSVGTMLDIDETYIFIRNGEAIIAKSMGEIEMTKDESKQLPTEQFASNTAVEWTSESDKRITVDENGKVTALNSRGTIRVFAQCGNAGYFWTVKMYEKSQYGNVYLSSSEEEMTVGVWCGSYHEFTDARLEELEAAGINLIIGVDEQWTGNGGIWSMLNRARDHGISVIADLRDWDGEKAPSYAKHPALKGFLMWDEPSATDFEKLAETKKKFDKVMPENLTFFVNLFPQACSYESLFGDDYDPKHVNYEKDYVDPFLDTVDPEQLSVDYYPLLKQDGSEALSIRPTYFENLDILSHKALTESLPFDVTILTAGHKTTDGTYVTASEEQLRWQMAIAMAYGATSLNHYIYTSHEADYEAIVEYETFAPTELYERVKAVNLEVQSWSDIYMSYSWLGTAKVDVGDKNLMLDKLSYNIDVDKYGYLSEITSDKDLLVGAFENAEHQYAYMIANAGDAAEIKSIDHLADFTMEAASVTLKLKQGKYQCVAVVSDGEISYLPVDADNSVSIQLGAYDGAFVIPIAESYGNTYIVKTGDTTRMDLLFAAFVLSCVGVAGVTVILRKKKYQ